MLAGSLDGLLDYKRLEGIRGFLGHIAMTYLVITPYVKGAPSDLGFIPSW
jgi:hypothetical protein